MKLTYSSDNSNQPYSKQQGLFVDSFYYKISNMLVKINNGIDNIISHIA